MNNAVKERKGIRMTSKKKTANEVVLEIVEEAREVRADYLEEQFVGKEKK